MDKLFQAAQAALDALLALGAEKASVRAASGETVELNALGGEFTLMRTLLDQSLSLTAIKGGRRGTAKLNRLDGDAIRQGAEDCLAVAESGDADPAWDLAPAPETGDFVSGALTADPDRLFDRSKELLEDIGRKFPHVIVEEMITEHKTETEVYLNSVGSRFTNRVGRYGVDLMFSGHQGDTATSFFGSSVSVPDLEKPFLELGTLANDLEAAERSLVSETTQGSRMGDILVHPDLLAEFLEVAGELFCGDSALIDGTSLWKDKLGQPVADPALTVYVKPLDERICGGERYTGEGFAAQDYTWLEGGVLKSFMLSLYGANRTGLPRALNTDGALVMAPGTKTKEALIAGIADGLLVGRFSGGEPSPNGDFSGVAKNSFLIQDGKLGCAVNETMISGNLADMLKNIGGISAELVCSGSYALPWVVFRNVVICGS